MKNTPAKKRRPANTNTFTFEFTTTKEGDAIRRGEMVQSFKGQKALIEGDVITSLGFNILTATLADNIMSLASLAMAQGFDGVKMVENAIKRLSPPETKKEEAKIIGIGKPKIIVN